MSKFQRHHAHHRFSRCIRTETMFSIFGSKCLLQGGAWIYSPYGCNIHYRTGDEYDDVEFRCCANLLRVVKSLQAGHIRWTQQAQRWTLHSEIVILSFFFIKTRRSKIIEKEFVLLRIIYHFPREDYFGDIILKMLCLFTTDYNWLIDRLHLSIIFWWVMKINQFCNTNTHVYLNRWPVNTVRTAGRTRCRRWGMKVSNSRSLTQSLYF